MTVNTLPHKHGQAADKLLEHIPGTDSFQILSSLFKQFSDPSRIRIFWILCHCEECVINISAMMDMSSPAVAHHLKLLRGSGLVQCRREGKEVYYKAAETQQVSQLHQMIEKMMAISCPKEENFR